MIKTKFRAWDGDEYRTSFVVHNEMGRPMITVNGNLEVMHGWVIEQYTGFRDKNGVDIYEGDVVNCHRFYFDGFGESEAEFFSEVYFNNMHAAFGVDEKWDDSDTGFYLISEILSSDPEGIEIIGNIHENQELL